MHTFFFHATRQSAIKVTSYLICAAIRVWLWLAYKNYNNNVNGVQALKITFQNVDFFFFFHILFSLDAFTFKTKLLKFFKRKRNITQTYKRIYNKSVSLNEINTYSLSYFILNFRLKFSSPEQLNRINLCCIHFWFSLYFK